VAIRDRNIYIWCDFFFVVLFGADLIVRCSLRNRTKMPSVLAFLRRNWTDCLAMFTDVPGVTGVGALSFLVLTRFRHVIRLFRVARILKVRARASCMLCLHKCAPWIANCSRDFVCFSYALDPIVSVVFAVACNSMWRSPDSSASNVFHSR